jgi:plasmid maintenance system antidote protein VapI
MLLGLMLGLLFRMWKGASLGLSLKNVSRTLAVAPITVNLLVEEREKVACGIVDLQEYV